MRWLFSAVLLGIGLVAGILLSSCLRCPPTSYEAVPNGTYALVLPDGPDNGELISELIGVGVVEAETLTIEYTDESGTWLVEYEIGEYAVLDANGDPL